MIDNVRDDLAQRADTARNALGDLAWLLRMAVVGAVAGALYTELRKPPPQRTWNGKLLGFVPYDFRLPSLEQLRSAYWNPRSPKVFSDRPLGVGWAVNIPTLLRRLGVHQAFTKGR
ncbi:MAG: hypothetical protein H0W17_01525 [Chloroflexi bacterium]|nr:hypothetical protein [Chloroflexota bacterium]